MRGFWLLVHVLGFTLWLGGGGDQRADSGEAGAARAGYESRAARGLQPAEKAADRRGVARRGAGANSDGGGDAREVVDGIGVGRSMLRPYDLSAVSLSTRCLTSRTKGCSSGSASFHRSTNRP